LKPLEEKKKRRKGSWASGRRGGRGGVVSLIPSNHSPKRKLLAHKGEREKRFGKRERLPSDSGGVEKGGSD